MKILNLLILDDDEINQNEYAQTIELYNQLNTSYNFEIYAAMSLSKAKDILNETIINYAIVDLKLTSNGFDSIESGNDLIKYIQESFKIPTAIISGFLNDLDVSVKKSIFLNIICRGDETTDSVLDKFCIFEKYDITNVFAQNGTLNQIIQNAFWNQIAIGFDLENSKFTINSDALLRYISNYIKESLSYDGVGNDVPYNPFEFYIIPSIHNKIQTGSLINYDSKNYIVLTPACDLANDKCDNYQIVEITPFKNHADINKCLNAVPSEEIDRIDKKLKNIVGNNANLKLHFLPPHKSFIGGLVNFQTVQSVNKHDLNDSADLIGSVTSEFLKDILARFGMYYSRQGQPTLSNLDYSYNLLYKNHEIN